MKTLITSVSSALLALAMVATPAAATPGGDGWVPAQQADQTAMVTELNADLSAVDGVQHKAGCFSMYQARGHINVATVSIRPLTTVADCGKPKDFGVLVLRKVNGHWTILASSTGLAGAKCEYYAKAPAKVVKLLTKIGPCYTA